MRRHIQIFRLVGTEKTIDLITCKPLENLRYLVKMIMKTRVILPQLRINSFTVTILFHCEWRT